MICTTKNGALLWFSVSFFVCCLKLNLLLLTKVNVWQLTVRDNIFDWWWHRLVLLLRYTAVLAKHCMHPADLASIVLSWIVLMSKKTKWQSFFCTRWDDKHPLYPYWGYSSMRTENWGWKDIKYSSVITQKIQQLYLNCQWVSCPKWLSSKSTACAKSLTGFSTHSYRC